MGTEHAAHMKEMKDVGPEHFTHEVKAFVTRRTELLLHRGLPITELARESDFLQEFYDSFLQERHARSVELNSTAIKEANQTILDLFGSKLGIVSCMDGRMPLTALFGFPMQAVRAMRLPGGDLGGFKRNLSTGSLEPDSEALFTQLTRHQESNGSATKFEVLNSHVGCAARGRTESSFGHEPKDGGLNADIRSKNEIGGAIKEHYGMVPILMATDPNTGYAYMGLGKDELLAQHHTYDEPVRRELAAAGRIISTEDLAKTHAPSFEEITGDWNVDWEHAYADTALQLWKNIKSMAESPVLSDIIALVRKSYPHRKYSDDEVRTRSLLLLSNSYLGWMYEKNGGHPYTRHVEKCVVVDFKNKGPFAKNTAFVVAPVQNVLDDNVALAQGIVRSNRSGGAFIDESNTYPDAAAFAQAPVPVIVKCEVPFDSSHEVWKTLNKLDLSGIKNDWLDDKEVFMKAVRTQINHLPGMYIDDALEAISGLWESLSHIYTGSATQTLADRGGIAVLPILVSNDRMPQTILQLVA